MSEEPISPLPNPEPDPMPPVPARSGTAVRAIALGTLVFAATLLLLLGATRLVERGGGSPGPSSSDPIVAGSSANPQPPNSFDPQPTRSDVPVGSGSPGSDSTAPPSAPSTASPTGDPVLVGAGDIGQCGSDGDEDTAALLDGIEGTVFTAGDNAYENGTAEQFRECYEPGWGRHRARTRPAPGNHDWETDGLKGYFDHFGAAAQGPDGSSWYSYDLGTWHIIVLDSTCDKVGGCDAASPQGRWLAADLAKSSAACTMAIFHHPRFTSGEHGDLETMDAFWRPLYAAGVDVIVNGHDHDYERFAPQDPDGKADSARGIREFVVGTGGAQLRGFKRIAPNSELRLAGGHGVLKFTLHDGSYDSEFIAAGNDFRDRGTAQKCH